MKNRFAAYWKKFSYRKISFIFMLGVLPHCHSHVSLAADKSHEKVQAKLIQIVCGEIDPTEIGEACVLNLSLTKFISADAKNIEDTEDAESSKSMLLLATYEAMQTWQKSLGVEPDAKRFRELNGRSLVIDVQDLEPVELFEALAVLKHRRRGGEKDLPAACVHPCVHWWNGKTK